MDFLINIIVTIAIIIVVLRRMAEVAKKGGDITGPPPPPPMFPEKREVPEMRQREVLVEEARRPEYHVPEEETVSDEMRGERARRTEERLREAQRRFEAQRRTIDEQRRLAEDQFESAREAAGEPVRRKPAPVPAKMRKARRAPTAKPLPVFSRAAIVQGFVMSEILGPPVSLRENSR